MTGSFEKNLLFNVSRINQNLSINRCPYLKHQIMTTISEVKSTLHKYVVETEDMEILNHISDYFRKLLKESGKIVAFTSDGKALTVEDYKKDIDEARDQIKRGESITQEELEKGSNNW